MGLEAIREFTQVKSVWVDLTDTLEASIPRIKEDAMPADPDECF
jgi:hypothetical protein